MVRVLQHPLAAHIMTHLRDVTTKPATFRTLAYQLSLLLAIEATRDLPTEEKPIETPLETMTGRVLAHQPLVVVPILRAGLGMVQPFLDTFPDVSVGYIGLERDHATGIARNYYCKLPPLSGRRIFLVDPMLATGGSAVKAVDVMKASGGADIILDSAIDVLFSNCAAVGRSAGMTLKIRRLCISRNLFSGAFSKGLNVHLSSEANMNAFTSERRHSTAEFRIMLLSIVSSPEGVAELTRHHPTIPILTAALDRELNARKYILPGLGDFGDRLYGT